MKIVKAYAPASIGNIGPGFDVLGMAITDLGDTVTAEKTRERNVVIRQIKGGDGTIPLETDRNTAGIAATRVLRMLKAKAGVGITLHKNIPGTGLGSSAASAVAAAVAVNVLFGNRLDPEELIEPCAAAERSISGGCFIDNVAASLLGGIIVSHGAERRAFTIGTLPDLIVVVVTPEHSVLTKISRAVLPGKVPMDMVVANIAYTATMVAAVFQKDVHRFGHAIQDAIVEPARGHLIPGFSDVKAAALKAGAMGCSISGSGASVFAVTDRKNLSKKIGAAMQKVFRQHGISAVINITRIDRRGARILSKR